MTSHITRYPEYPNFVRLPCASGWVWLNPALVTSVFPHGDGAGVTSVRLSNEREGWLIQLDAEVVVGALEGRIILPLRPVEPVPA